MWAECYPLESGRVVALTDRGRGSHGAAAVFRLHSVINVRFAAALEMHPYVAE
jgi:hypothetical protein